MCLCLINAQFNEQLSGGLTNVCVSDFCLLDNKDLSRNNFSSLQTSLLYIYLYSFNICSI